MSVQHIKTVFALLISLWLLKMGRTQNGAAMHSMLRFSWREMTEGSEAEEEYPVQYMKKTTSRCQVNTVNDDTKKPLRIEIANCGIWRMIIAQYYRDNQGNIHCL